MKSILLVLLLSLSSFAYSSCPLYFKSEHLCGKITWVKGPLLNKTSAFELKFWPTGSHENEMINPKGAIRVFS